MAEDKGAGRGKHNGWGAIPKSKGITGSKHDLVINEIISSVRTVRKRKANSRRADSTDDQTGEARF